MISTKYIRQTILPEIGETGQQKLHDAKVLVIGAGGLGCPVLQNLAGMGIGTIGIVDGDCVHETNLHRQLLYTNDDCGRKKVIVAKEVLKKINPNLKVVTYDEYLSKVNIETILSEFDIIVDCTDEIPIRYLLNDYSVALKKPLVYASIHKFQGQLTVFNYNSGPSYRCLFPNENNNTPTCSTTGVLGVIPNILGTLQANEVVKVILNLGQILSGKLLIFDALHSKMSHINFTKNEEQIKKALANIALLKDEIFLETNLNVNINALNFAEKINQGNCKIIDIREENEYPKLNNYYNIIYAPLNQINELSSLWDKNQEYILCCQKGKRSAIALNILLSKGFINVKQLENGIESLDLTFLNK